MPFDLVAHDSHFEVSEEERSAFDAKTDQKKPGGSNAGKYKKGPFCGPSGGAPAGTFPVTTLKRARAALSYAHNAPNPAGIKACVYRHWPELKKGAKGKQSEAAPVAAFSLADKADNCSRFEFKESPDKAATMDMTAYSGGVIPDHYYWGNLGIDLNGMCFLGKKFPILADHDTSKIIGFSSKPTIEDNALMIRDVTFLDTPYAQEFKENSKKGFPYQASIRATPTKIRRIAEGESAMVNGHKVIGPGTVWENCTFKEASVCVFGYDPNTKSAAMSNGATDEVEVSFSENYDEPYHEEESQMAVTLDQFRDENPEEFKKLSEDIAAQAKQEASDQLKAKDEELSSLRAKQVEMDKNFTKMEIFMEKAKADQIAATANSIVITAFVSPEVESLPAKVKGKLKDQFQSLDAFMKDGEFDVEAFKAFVAAELKDYTDMFKDAKPTDPKILGAGSFGKEPTEMQNGSEEEMLSDPKITAALDRMGKIVRGTGSIGEVN